ncbi:aldo/keto reductase family protein [Collimonas fungivorans]|uniref:Aldo/keto reductase family protein n=1 Tax=Collimonas fungivorans TaxID=158899 RepID=A0A127PG54_9BURK|nr:aldo/keto reductase [Collimonas fungivorans]AMO96782.1 aldo/keto reductase family protein [Collimonas fungivorans]
MKTLLLPSGAVIPVLGQGTWYMGEDPARKKREIDALQLGMGLGMTLIDTAEMYADGGAEKVVGEAIRGRRDEVFVVSKVYPHNADRRGMQAACERSLKRLGCDHIDLYLLHWPGSVPLLETFEAFESLKKSGKIRDFGVSNFDRDGMQEASELHGGGQLAVNQVLYNLKRRGVEWDLLPWCRERAIPVMAYSPLESSASEQRRLLGNPQLLAVAARHAASPAQIALAWLLRQEQVIVIPKAVAPAHVRENRAALDIVLTAQDLVELDQAFPPPRHGSALDMR